MKILITGGAGFIGSHLSKALLKDGHDVLVVDNLSTGMKENIPKMVGFLELDLTDKKTYEQLPVDIDFVYHLASQASGEVSCDDPVYDLKANTLTTLSLLQWCKKTGIKKFIFTSSMGVYSDKLGYPVDEGSPIQPKSFYGINKQSSEGYIRIFSEEGLRATVFRLFNVYGPGQNMKNLKQGMVSIYLSFINDKSPIYVKGPLTRIRDFVYIDDVVSALKLGLDERADNEVYNICTNKHTTVGDLLEALIEQYPKNKSYPIEIHDRTPRDIDECYGSYDKIYTQLGWEPQVNLKEGIGRMIAWLKSYSF